MTTNNRKAVQINVEEIINATISDVVKEQIENKIKDICAAKMQGEDIKTSLARSVDIMLNAEIRSSMNSGGSGLSWNTEDYVRRVIRENIAGNLSYKDLLLSNVRDFINKNQNKIVESAIQTFNTEISIHMRASVAEYYKQLVQSEGDVVNVLSAMKKAADAMKEQDEAD